MEKEVFKYIDPDALLLFCLLSKWSLNVKENCTDEKWRFPKMINCFKSLCHIIKKFSFQQQKNETCKDIWINITHKEKTNNKIYPWGSAVVRYTRKTP